MAFATRSRCTPVRDAKYHKQSGLSLMSQQFITGSICKSTPKLYSHFSQK